MVDKKISRTKTFSQNMIYMFCLYHFSLKCIIKKNYLPSYSPLKNIKKNGIYYENWAGGMYLNVYVYKEFAELAERAKIEFAAFSSQMCIEFFVGISNL